jgi:four helix bundle protein
MELEELEVYNLSLEMANEIWDIVIKWNYFEKDTVGKQVCKSADSISANIAEGFGRFHYNENKLFCFYGRGSLMETKNWLIKMKIRKLITEEQHIYFLEKTNRIGKKLNNYIKSIGPTKIN